MSNNLPPGVTDSMIPGNRPEDGVWEDYCENVTSELASLGMDVDDLHPEDVDRLYELIGEYFEKDYGFASAAGRIVKEWATRLEGDN